MNATRAITVLVHGLWMHGVTMEFQRRYIERMGFDVVSYSYPTVRYTLTENTERLARFAGSLAAASINWVGHSLGGLVILRLLERESALPSGRVVMLGVPCCGSHAGRALSRNTVGARALGRSMNEWMSSRRSMQFPGREIGVIAGSVGIGLGRLAAPDLPTPNDGAVTVAETELEGASDRIVLPINHIGMLLSRRVARQTVAFLREGRFDHGAGKG